jgi:hypothetical protein
LLQGSHNIGKPVLRSHWQSSRRNRAVFGVADPDVASHLLNELVGVFHPDIENPDARGWRCWRCHPLTGLATGEFKEART